MNIKIEFAFSIFLIQAFCSQGSKQEAPSEFDWSSWWSYDGISGPGFWGVINRLWRLCSDGKRQSPIDIVTQSLVFDQTLKEIQVDSTEVDGKLTNTGFGLQWLPKEDSSASASEIPISSPSSQPLKPFRISGASLHYQYQLSHISIRWASSGKGSEHILQGQTFPAEVQVFFFNVDLYGNFSAASDQPNGVAAVSVLVKVGWRSNPVLKIFMDHLHLVPHRGKSTWTPFVPIRELFTSRQFLTYEGSLTEPPCEETVTWIVLNKPAYVTADQLYQLESIRRGSQGQSSLSAGNVRPIQSLHNRVIRTNIPSNVENCRRDNSTDIYRVLQLEES